MAHRRAALACAAASALVIAAALSACVAEPSPSPDASATESSGPSPSGTGTPAASASPSPTSDAVPIPADCRAILTAGVLAQLEGTPLNDPASGIPTGAQPDGSLVCLWRDPRADTTHLITTITYVSRGPALDMLNELANVEGFSCYTPDGGTRCEKTWFNEQYPVVDGRTLFWREDVLIDTRFSNLAPSGYTSAIVASIFG